MYAIVPIRVCDFVFLCIHACDCGVVCVCFKLVVCVGTCACVCVCVYTGVTMFLLIICTNALCTCLYCEQN